jgi:predicted NUDIX family NTP pyrophosphohydrolase
MGKTSAGILIYRFSNDTPEYLLVHPGGPFWKNKDLASWSIPKGEVEENENIFEAAKRELKEETGLSVAGEYTVLTPVKQKGNKTVFAWAVEQDIDTEKIQSNMFEMEWPPKSGKRQFFPEIDKAAWFTPEMAREKIIPAQILLIVELEKKFSSEGRLPAGD